MPFGEDEIVRRLEAMPQIDPPPDLRPSIMAAVRAMAVRPGSIAAPLVHRPRRVAFAAGWAIAAAIMLIFLAVARPRP